MGNSQIAEHSGPAGLPPKPPDSQRAQNRRDYLLIAVITTIALIPVAIVAISNIPKWVALADVANHRAQWDQAGITHYEMVVDCGGCGSYYDQMPWTLEVKNDKLVSAINAQGQPVDGAKGAPIMLSLRYEDTAQLTVT